MIRVPKAVLGKHACKVSRLTAVRIPGDAGLPRLARRFCCGGRHRPGRRQHRAATTPAWPSTWSTSFAGCTSISTHRDRRVPGSTAELLIHAQAYIDARLGDPSLNPEELARACFISTRYLHRVFETAGLSVCDFIRSARLERCRRDLIDPAFADEPISAIASRWGLPSAPHFSRLFRRAYGCSPRQFRQSAPPADGANGARDGEPTCPPASWPLEHGEPWADTGWTPKGRPEA